MNLAEYLKQKHGKDLEELSEHFPCGPGGLHDFACSKLCPEICGYCSSLVDPKTGEFLTKDPNHDD